MINNTIFKWCHLRLYVDFTKHDDVSVFVPSCPFAYWTIPFLCVIGTSVHAYVFRKHSDRCVSTRVFTKRNPWQLPSLLHSSAQRSAIWKSEQLLQKLLQKGIICRIRVLSNHTSLENGASPTDWCDYRQQRFSYYYKQFLLIGRNTWHCFLLAPTVVPVVVYRLLCRHAYSVPTYSIQVGKGFCEKLCINSATCVENPHPPTSGGGWVGGSKNWKLKLCMFAKEQHVLDPHIVFYGIKVYLNGG